MEPEVNAPSTAPPLANDNQTTMANSSSPTDPPSASNEPPSYPPYNLEHVVSEMNKVVHGEAPPSTLSYTSTDLDRI
jgi:hypothetical protein